VTVLGKNAHSATGAQTNSCINGIKKSITSVTVFELNHYIGDAEASLGLGLDITGDTRVEVYSTVSIIKEG
jgi:hypothetical protein